jgi:D-psicose/D-tagatose/L-ribulose 3-epimerase
MRFGVNTLVWTMQLGAAHQPLFARIKQWGFDGAEIFLSPGEPRDITGIRRILDEQELGRTTCSALPPEVNPISSDASVRQRARDFLLACVERTAEVGAKLLCGPLYAGLGVRTGQRRTETEWQYAVEALQIAAERGRQLGVMLCIEPLNRFETYFLNTQADAARLVQQTGAPNLRIHYDTFHANIEEAHPAESLRSIAPFLGHFHASENDRGIPGSGHVDWAAAVRVLRDVGYNGWVTIESFAQPEPALAAAAAIWRDLAPSGDELARQGLQFLKQLLA